MRRSSVGDVIGDEQHADLAGLQVGLDVAPEGLGRALGADQLGERDVGGGAGAGAGRIERGLHALDAPE